MKWADIFSKCNQSSLGKYYTTLRNASFSGNDSDEKYICNNNQAVFSLPDWKKDHQIEAKDVDCIYVDCKKCGNNIPNSIYLIEFKGGKTIQDWDEGTIRLKLFDTIHCILPKLIESNSWTDLFSDTCKLVFVLAISPNNGIIKKQSDFDKLSNPRNIIKSAMRQVEINKKSAELKELEQKLKKYTGKTPFSCIYIVDATNYSIDNPRGYYYKISL